MNNISCTEYDENRKALSDLIFKMKVFTEQELIDKFTEIRGGNIEIGGLQTISDYIDCLRDFDVLRLEGRHFHTQDWPQVLAA